MAASRLIRLPEVCSLVGLRRSAVYELEARGEFPKRRKLTPRASAWKYDEIIGWIENRPLADPQRPAA